MLGTGLGWSAIFKQAVEHAWRVLALPARLGSPYGAHCQLTKHHKLAPLGTCSSIARAGSHVRSGSSCSSTTEVPKARGSRVSLHQEIQRGRGASLLLRWP